jgi:OOP family OmpA-OmpF porin
MRYVLKSNFVIGLFGLIFLAACAPTTRPVAPSAETGAVNPVEAVNHLESEIAGARQDQHNVLSPNEFAKAEAFYRQAKKDLEKEGEIADILKDVTTARTHLKNAAKNAEVARTIFPEVIESRKIARAAGATKLEKEYTRVEERFLDLTRAIEKNNIHYAQRNSAKVNEDYRAIELRAIKTETIGEVRTLIDQAEKAGAKKSAPRLLAFAKKQLEETDAFITANPYAKVEMNQKADEALFMARRLLTITDQSKKLQYMKPEETALWMEDILFKVTQQTSARDMRDQSFNTQVDNILESIKSMQEDNRFMAGKLKSQRNEIETLSQKMAAKEEILTEQAAEKQFNQRFNEVQNYFEANEAEIYKQGNKLVIRLRIIQFPIGQAIILPKNYPLLSKIQQAIRTFGEPSVVIEGHTDSTGTIQVNQHLSQQRAEAVREYLIANQTLPAYKIVAAGYGSERPLASNATPEGRAINRRIDVIITPEAKPQR